jgi:hypothetical protein
MVAAPAVAWLVPVAAGCAVTGDALDDVLVVVAVVVVLVVVETAGVGFRAISGNSFGTTTLQPTRSAIERITAMNMRFSIFKGRGPNLQD